MYLTPLIVSTIAFEVSYRGLWLQVSNQQWEQMEPQETKIQFSCKYISKKKQQKIHSMQNFPLVEPCDQEAKGTKSQKFQQ